ncbi:MAG TPA: hypothetical protein VK695_08435 [Steroidobacteraceae bacterium]|jgi:hypothetical protein|nr:hypothetical protein [Steroidobacteraceae bacterium]
MGGQRAHSALWRGTLRRELAVLLVLKGLALALLWLLFFSGDRQPPAGAGPTSARLGLEQPAPPPAARSRD